MVNIIAVLSRCGKVAKNQLRQLLFFFGFPDGIDIFDASINLASCKVRQHGIEKPLLQCQLSAVVGHFEHIIYLYGNCFASDFICTRRKPLYHFRLKF